MINRQTIFLLILSSLLAFSANAQFPAPYCGFFASSTEPITLVRFAGIENYTSNSTNASDHEDFTGISACVMPGSTYTIQLQGNTDGSYTNYFFVYIDWNQDGNFNQANEQYLIGSLNNSNGSPGSPILSGSIAVPANAVLGSTRMRVAKNFNSSAHIPCGNISFGQAEDYTVSVGTPQLTQIGYTTSLGTFGQLNNAHTNNALTNWSNGVCRGSGTSTTIPNLQNGVGYVAENNTAAASCSPFLSTAYLQVWGQGVLCNNLGPTSGVALNTVSFVANFNGSHLLNISSNLCGSTVNSNCQGGLGHDFTGQSAALRYRQATTITNTTSTDTLCIGNSRTISYTLNGDHNNPDVEVNITQGAGLGTFANNTFTPTQSGLVTVRTKVGVLYDDASFYITSLDTISDAMTLCQSELPYIWNGVTIPTTALTGDIFTTTLSSQEACPDVYKLEVTIHNDYDYDETHSICSNGLPFTWHGQTWGANVVPGTYNHTASYTTISGCDSIYNLTLNVHPVYADVESLTLCNSELPYVWNGINIPVGTVSNPAYDSVTLTSQNGCDSSVVLALTINTSYHQTAIITICDAELPYTWGSETIPLGTVNGQIFNYNYPTQEGCDSNWAVEVFVNPTYYEELDVIICEGEIYQIGNQEFTQPVTNHTVSFQTVDGCDSVFVLNLQVNDSISIPWDGGVAELCEGDTIVLDATTPHVDNYNWNTGALTGTIDITEGGIYAVQLVDQDGACAANATYEVIQRYKPYIPTLASGTYCEGDTVVLNAGAAGYKYLWSTGDTTQHLKVFETGVYTVNVESIYGCESTASTEFEFYPKTNYDNWETMHISGYKYQFILHNPSNILAYHWDFGDGNTSNLPQPIHEYEGPGVYTAFVTLTGMCGDSEFYQILTLDKSVGINEVASDDYLKIYPNPTKDILEVNLKNDNDKIIHYKVWDTKGRLVLEEQDLNQSSAKINVESLIAGAYVIEVISVHQSIKKMFIKEK